MHFINGLERDKTFFLISAVTLTGQQGGLVNLRLRLITYLHAEDASQLPPSSEPEGDDTEQPAATPREQSTLPPTVVRPAPMSVATIAEGR